MAEQTIDLKPNLLVKYLPNVEIMEECGHCQAKLIAKLPSRASKTNWHPDRVCPKCRHIEYYSKQKSCVCEKCLLKDQTKRTRLKVLLEKNRPKDSIDILTVPMRERLIIAVLLQEANVGLGAVIPPYHTYVNGETETSIEILADLQQGKLINIAPCSQLEAFTKKDEDDFYAFDFSKVHYEINITAENMREWEIHKQLCRPAITRVEDATDVVLVWIEIVSGQLLELLKALCVEYDLAKELEKEETKIIQAIQRWLDGLTPSQVYALIWIGVRKACGAKVSGSWGNYRFHEINYLIKEIDSYLKKAQVNNELIGSYNYPKKVGIKLSTTIFFEDMLQLKDWYNTKVVTKTELINLLTKNENSIPFYEELKLRNSEDMERTLKWVLKEENSFEISEIGVVIYIGKIEWLFTTEEVLYRLSKKIEHEQNFLIDYENDKWVAEMRTHMSFSIDGIYSTMFILKLIRALLSSNLSYFNSVQLSEKADKS